MIERISIQNFQSHKETVLDLVSGINIIYGLGFSGKSAIIRALNWIVFNRPSGYRFHSHFSDDPTKVSVIVDGKEVTYSKSERETSYKFDGKTFSSFGQSIPNPVKDHFNLTSLNFANQLDPPFMVMGTPGEIGKIFNQLTKAEQVDNWISLLTTKINTSNTVIKVNQNEVEELETQLNKLKKLDYIQPVVDKYIKYQERIESLSELISEIERIYYEYQEIQNFIKSIQTAKVDKYYTELCECFDGIKNHQTVIRKLEELKTKSEESERIKKVLKEIEPIIKELEEIKEEEKEYKMVIDLSVKLLNAMEEADQIRSRLEKESELFSSTLKKLGKCPLCFSIIDSKTIKRIEKDLK